MNQNSEIEFQFLEYLANFKTTYPLKPQIKYLTGVNPSSASESNYKYS